MRFVYPTLLFVLLLLVLTACSKDSNPAVPGAPRGDVLSRIEKNPTIKVGLLSFTPQKRLFVSISRGEFKCYVAESLQDFQTGYAGQIFEFAANDETIEIKGGFGSGADEENSRPANRIVRIEPVGGVENGHIMIGPDKEHLRSYRGILRLTFEGKNILAVNELPLEDYLLGVVPAEMDPTWPEDALKAQAVASRTYALFNLNRYGNRGFDIADDHRSQLYGGVDVETDVTTRDVVQTVDEVVTFNNQLACAVFHEESGGHTASNLDVWPDSGSVQYLEGIADTLGVVDFSSDGQYKEWSSTATFDQLKEAFNRDGLTYVGDYLSAISILGLSENGRIQMVDLLGWRNPIVGGIDMCRILNLSLGEDFLPSNMFTIAVAPGGYTFTGSGKGHGVGMSQWGAHQRALADQTYIYILTQYFPGTEVKPIPFDGIEVVHNTFIDLIH
jgi:stage II sporulation protein D